MINCKERKNSLFVITAGAGLTAVLACLALGAMAERLGNKYLVTANWYGIGFGERNPNLDPVFQAKLLQDEAETLTTTGNGNTSCRPQSVTIAGKTENIGISCPNMIEIYLYLFKSYLRRL